MKIIKKLVMSQNLTSSGGAAYIKYTYMIKEGHGEHEATSTRRYKIGEAVRSWFDGTNNTAVIGKLCQKCGKAWNEKNAIEHEYCELPPRDYR